MYSFFQYTPVVNYGSKVEDTATVNNQSVFTMACGRMTVPQLSIIEDYGNKLISLDER